MQTCSGMVSRLEQQVCSVLPRATGTDPGKGLAMGYFQGDILKATTSADVVQLGSVSLERERMMEQFGLDPTTQVNGLMTIFRCASNTPALRPRKLEALLRAQRRNPERPARSSRPM